MFVEIRRNKYLGQSFVLCSIFLCLAILPGCFLGQTREVPAEEEKRVSNSLKVLVWNAWRGGNEVDQGPEKILAVIRESQADVVLMQESYDIDGERPLLGEWLAQELGWNQWQGDSPHLCVLTRYEMAETFSHEPWHGVGAKLVHPNGGEFLAWSIWLDYRDYIPYVVRDNPEMSDEELLKSEFERSQRLPQAERLLDRLEALGHIDSTLPLIVGGDWNTPSHLDWTRDTAAVFKRRRELDLPVSKMMESYGFEDVYRSLHPDPVHHPGITWSPMFRGTEEKEQGFDRIDRLYLHEFSRSWNLKPVSATVYPQVWEDVLIEVPDRIFPSDHSAVLLEMEMAPQPLRSGDPVSTVLETQGWKVDAAARKISGDQVDVSLSLSRAGNVLAAPRVWVQANQSAEVEISDGDRHILADVHTVTEMKKIKVSIDIQVTEKGHQFILPTLDLVVR